ncbi:MAG: PAS domain-containing sensor histidine kinase, partial [Actinobacteria bacterium]|nr:PAS domain-containing sensor histidine kinase [Actinomycetota bacterium]
VHEILGYTPGEWLAHATFWADHLHTDDRERAVGEFIRSATHGTPFDLEYRFFAKDGATVWLRDLGHVVPDGEGKPALLRGLMVDITAVKQMEEQRRDVETRFRLVVERLPAIVYIQSAGEIDGGPGPMVYVSPQVREIMGSAPDEWIGEAGARSRRIHPEDDARVRAQLDRSALTGEPFSADYRMVRRDGGEVWFHDEAVLVHDDQGTPMFWQGILYDVTGQREAESRASDAQARYRALVEHTPAITYIDAVEGPTTTMYISPQTTDILGYTPQEWYDDPRLWNKIVHPEDDNRDERVEAGTHSSEYRMIAKDGRVVWVHDQASLIADDQGNPRCWQGVLIDITQQKRTEQLEQDLAVERETAQRLRDLDDMKNTFLQAVSHDLRTPLAAILGLAVTMGRQDIELEAVEAQDMARRIATNARKLDRLVNDLLDLDRLSRGIVEPALRPTDLGALVRNLVGESELIAERRVNLEVQPVTILVDGAKVERIVENLLANTARHTPASTQLWVRVEPMGDGALIVVEDDGPGVPEDLREHIFEPFMQGPSLTKHSSGVGVGLALVARFAELHGGRAWVQARPGGGASFRVYLSGVAAGDLVDVSDRS